MKQCAKPFDTQRSAAQSSDKQVIQVLPQTYVSRSWVYTVINQSFKDCYSKSRNQFIYHGLITLNQGSLLASQSSCFFDFEKSMVLSVKSLCAS